MELQDHQISFCMLEQGMERLLRAKFDNRVAGGDRAAAVLGEYLVFAALQKGQFEVVPNQLDNWSVEWVNRSGETGLPYDLRLTGLGNSSSRHIFLEVKTTTNISKCVFEISLDELECAKEHRDDYMIARVFLASAGPPKMDGASQDGSTLHRIVIIKSPYKMIQKGHGMNLLLRF